MLGQAALFEAVMTAPGLHIVLPLAQGTISLAARVGAGRALAIAGKKEQALDPVSKCNSGVFSQTDNRVPFSLMKIFVCIISHLPACSRYESRQGQCL